MDFYLDGKTLYKKSSDETFEMFGWCGGKKKVVKKFMERDLICRYGPLEKINNARTLIVGW